MFDRPGLLSHGYIPGRTLALDIVEHALKAVDPYRAVLRHVGIRGDVLRVDDQEYDLDRYEHIYVVGGGKACYPQALAVEELLGDRIEDGFISVKKGQLAPFIERLGPLRHVRVEESAHPVPDETSLHAGEQILAIADRAAERDLVLALMSGGTSSQVIAPVGGISVADIARAHHLVITGGLDITEIMTVRGHLSGIKCGGLARRIHPATIVTLVVSDEKNDAIRWNTDWVTPNGTAPADAMDILKRYDLWQRMPGAVRAHLSMAATSAPVSSIPPDARIQRCQVVWTRELFDAAIEQSRHLGLHPVALTSVVTGESREVGRVLVSIAHEVMRTGRPVTAPCALIATGETAVRLRGEVTGQGGANQELAVGACLDLAREAPVAILALDTDGTDGPTDIAGALTDGMTHERARRAGIDLYRALDEHDVSRALLAAGDALITGPTGTNVNDIVVIVVGRSQSCLGSE